MSIFSVGEIARHQATGEYVVIARLHFPGNPGQAWVIKAQGMTYAYQKLLKAVPTKLWPMLKLKYGYLNVSGKQLYTLVKEAKEATEDQAAEKCL